MLQKIFQKQLGSVFAKNVTTLLSGTVVSQGISFILVIILQKWFYSPGDFGILSLFLSISNVIVSISTLKYEYAIVLTKSRESAILIAVLCLCLSLASSLLTIPGMIWLIPVLIPQQNSLLTILIWATPVIVLTAGAYEALSYWHNHQSTYRRISISRVGQSLTTELTRFALIPAYLGGKSLIIGRLIGQLAATLYLLPSLYGSFVALNSKVTWKKIKAVALEYRDLPIYTMPTIFLSNLTNYLLIQMFFGFYGSSTVGLVSVSIQYIAVPFTIISGAFAPVFFKKIVDIPEKGVLLTVYKNFLFKLGTIGVAGIIIVYLVPDSWIIGVLGSKWEGLPDFMRLTVLWQTVAFVPSALSFIYTRLRKQWIMTVFAFSQLIVVYVSLLIGHSYFETSYGTFVVYVIGQSVYYLTTITAALLFIRKSTILS